MDIVVNGRTYSVADEPDRPLLGLSELLAAGVRDERHRQPVGLLAEHSSDEVDPGDDVPPLVLAAHLKDYAVVPHEHVEVIGLENHVVELQEREPCFEP